MHVATTPVACDDQLSRFIFAHTNVGAFTLENISIEGGYPGVSDPQAVSLDPIGSVLSVDHTA